MQRRRFLVAALGMLAATAIAQPAEAHDLLTQAQAGPIADEVKAFRSSFAGVIASRDAARLREMFRESFTHTHGSGRVDGRDARVGQLLAGDPVIETAPASDLSARVLTRDTVILAAVSPILNASEAGVTSFAGCRSTCALEAVGISQPAKRRGYLFRLRGSTSYAARRVQSGW